MTPTIFDSDEFNQRLFFPRPDVTQPPAGATDLRVAVPGATLHARLHAAAAARCTLLLFHGNGEVVADYDDSAARFALAGARLVVADYRGYGDSAGTPTLRALITDAPVVAAAVAQACPGPLVIMGRSLGGAAAHALYRDPPAGTVGFVLESALFDVAALVRRRGIARAVGPAERAVLDPAAWLAAGRAPLLVLHGELDQIIAPSEARAALAAAGAAADAKTLVPIAGRGHNDVSLAPSYWAALAAFISRVA
ncbi:MAG: alpha/beta hydrolase [Kofleriaceae bacterium]